MVESDGHVLNFQDIMHAIESMVVDVGRDVSTGADEWEINQSTSPTSGE